jgi:hypothetical protein
MAIEHWEISNEARESLQPYVDHLERTCPEMLAVQVRRLMALAKAHLPPMSTWEATFFVKCLCGFGMSFAETVPSKKIAEMIADHLRETILVEFGAEWLAKEAKEFGDDPEWQAHFSKMRENVFADRLEKSLNPLQAYLLVVMAEFYWQREFATTEPGESVGKAVLSDFLNIEDPQSQGEG